MANKGLQWHKKSFSVGLYSKNYEKNWEKAFKKQPKNYSKIIKTSFLILLGVLLTLCLFII